ncbi:MAG TPA: helix-turn-helix transcriptional regulator [Candidatus Thermoplasmatota archaeon]|nr:helix-turn-helix transcriptional regulator [Candidatus Thermoplasmatota archaeon]
MSRSTFSPRDATGSDREADAPLTVEARERLLDSPTRREFVALVEAQPGLTMTMLRDSLNLGWGSLVHHLRILTRSGLLEVKNDGRRRLVFPRGYVRSKRADAYSGMLHGEAALRVAQAIADHPGVGVESVSMLADVSLRVAYYHTKRLIDAGFVETSRARRLRGLRATQRLHDALALRAQEPPQSSDPRQSPPRPRAPEDG